MFNTHFTSETLEIRTLEPQDEGTRRIDKLVGRNIDSIQLIQDLLLVSGGKFYYDSGEDKWIYTTLEKINSLAGGNPVKKYHTKPFTSSGNHKYNFMIKGERVVDDSQFTNSVILNYREPTFEN